MFLWFWGRGWCRTRMRRARLVSNAFLYTTYGWKFFRTLCKKLRPGSRIHLLAFKRSLLRNEIFKKNSRNFKRNSIYSLGLWANVFRTLSEQVLAGFVKVAFQVPIGIFLRKNFWWKFVILDFCELLGKIFRTWYKKFATSLLKLHFTCREEQFGRKAFKKPQSMLKVLWTMSKNSAEEMSKLHSSYQEEHFEEKNWKNCKVLWNSTKSFRTASKIFSVGFSKLRYTFQDQH